MITLCKKTLHTFLGISTDDLATAAVHRPRTTTSPSPSGGLIFLAGDCRKSANILESSALKTNSSPLKKDPEGLLFPDETNNNGSGTACNGASGSNGGGLSSCTESLGFESSEYHNTEETIDYASSKRMDEEADDRGPCCRRKKRSRERLRWREEVRNRKLPPPLSSLNENGKSSFFLKPVRANGRLVLTEVKISRPEIFHASRQDGRLRLHIAGSATGSESESESQSDEKQPEPVREDAVTSTATTPIEAIDEEEVEEIQEEEEGRGGNNLIWKIPVRIGEGFRRCHEMSNHHNHHHRHHRHHHSPFPLQCVITR